MGIRKELEYPDSIAVSPALTALASAPTHEVRCGTTIVKASSEREHSSLTRVRPVSVGSVEEGSVLPGSAKFLDRRPPKALPDPGRDSNAGEICRGLEAGLLVLGNSDLEREWS